MNTKTLTSCNQGGVEGDDFDQFSKACQTHFGCMVKEYGPDLFIVESTSELYLTFLSNLNEADRQHHTCNCCRHFIQRFGNLAAIKADGSIVSALWPYSRSIPRIYQASCTAMARAVERGYVRGVFLWDKSEIWGNQEAGGWQHLHVQSPKPNHSRRDLTTDQAMAGKREDFRTLAHGLGEFFPATVTQALNILESDSLYRGEKVAGPAKFLHELQERIRSTHGKARTNHVWKAVASAPAGFCTPRSSMIGTLLADIQSGLPLDSVKSRFAAKMHPLQYQRPQAPATAGNIRQAEKLFADLGLEPSLRRRFARFEEVEKIWEPTPDPKEESPGGIFGHLAPKSHGLRAGSRATPLLPEQKMTWEKFRRTVLPSALKMEVMTGVRGNYCGLVTAVHPDAPPIFQWDTDEQRNPVSWYVYNSESRASQWGLPTNEWVEVTGVTQQPCNWFGREDHRFGNAVMFILKGAADKHMTGLALFPETLKAYLHAVRATIEAFSKTRSIEDAENASACGLLYGSKGGPEPIRVNTKLGTTIYRIDRWD